MSVEQTGAHRRHQLRVVAVNESAGDLRFIPILQKSFLRGYCDRNGTTR